MTKIKLVVFDLDDTLTIGPTIWELIHIDNQSWHSHGIPFWESFKKGEYGFNAFIRKDVASWKGLSVRQLKKIISKIKYIPDLKKTVWSFKKNKIKTAIVSSGLEFLANHTAQKFGIDYCFANPLEIAGGRLTGKIKLLVAGSGKGRTLMKIKRKLKLKKKEILAVGDSAFDLPMFREVGTSVTFQDAQPAVKKLADYVIAKNDLFKIVKIIEQKSKDTVVAG